MMGTGYMRKIDSRGRITNITQTNAVFSAKDYLQGLKISELKELIVELFDSVANNGDMHAFLLGKVFTMPEIIGMNEKLNNLTEQNKSLNELKSKEVLVIEDIVEPEEPKIIAKKKVNKNKK